MKPDIWYYYDPNNRKNDPLGAHCIRCKKKFKPGFHSSGVKAVILHHENPWIMIAPPNTHQTDLYFIGPECINKLTEII